MTLCINPRCDKPENSDNAQFCQNCRSSLLLKQRYRATKVLGGGGFGKTYEAADLGVRNKVIKVLINNSPKAVELFQREAEVLSQLNNLGIPKVEPGSYIVFHPADGQVPVHCLVMEKVEGMNLWDYLKQLRHSIDSETAERWLKELVLILQEVHEKGILHRDIKPQNIIFKPDGRLALIDFGAVRGGTGTEFATAAGSGGGTEVSSHMAGGTSIISAGYTAPEQMNGQAMRQSDFYSLGRTFIFLLTGKEPSEISYDAYNDVLQWRKHAPDVKSKLVELLDQMQSTQVRQRPRDAAEVLQKLQSGQGSTRIDSGNVQALEHQAERIPEPPQSFQPTPPQPTTPLFLYIPISRLIILSLFSAGLYQAYWIYKNWRYLKEREGLKIQPFWRGFFGVFFLHKLLNRIAKDKAATIVQVPTFSPNGLATAWVILAVVDYFIPASPVGLAISFTLTFFQTLFFVPVQNYINAVTQKQTPRHPFYKWSAGHTVCLLIGIMTWLILLFLPS